MAFDRATGKKVWETTTAGATRTTAATVRAARRPSRTTGCMCSAAAATSPASTYATGRKIWSINLIQKFGGRNPYWGYSESPLIVGDRILVNAGGPRASIVAIAKADGADVVAEPLRRGRLLVAHADAHRQPQPGDLLHRLAHARRGSARRPAAVVLQQGRQRHANIATPIVRGTRVFLSSDYGTGAALLDIRAAGNLASANEVYFTRDMRNHHASSVLIEDHLYGFSSSILTALKFDTGAMAWRDRSVGKGSLIFADQRLYLYSEDGVVGLAEASPAGYREHGRFTLAQQSGLPTWSHPIISGGLLIIRDQDNVYAYDVKAK